MTRDALRAQLDARQRLLAAGARHVGWKVAYDMPGIDEPVFGHLTTATVVPDGGAVDVAGIRALRVETELVVDVDGGVAVGLEVVDVARDPIDRILARNVFHRAAVLGPPCSAVLIGARARIFVAGALAEDAPVDRDPEATVGLMRAMLPELGEALQPGDRILAGSSTHVPAQPGDTVTAEIDGLGRVSARLT